MGRPRVRFAAHRGAQQLIVCVRALDETRLLEFYVIGSRPRFIFPADGVQRSTKHELGP